MKYPPIRIYQWHLFFPSNNAQESRASFLISSSAFLSALFFLACSRGLSCLHLGRNLAPCSGTLDVRSGVFGEQRPPPTSWRWVICARMVYLACCCSSGQRELEDYWVLSLLFGGTECVCDRDRDCDSDSVYILLSIQLSPLSLLMCSSARELDRVGKPQLCKFFFSFLFFPRNESSLIKCFHTIVIFVFSTCVQTQILLFSSNTKLRVTKKSIYKIYFCILVRVNSNLLCVFLSSFLLFDHLPDSVDCILTALSYHIDRCDRPRYGVHIVLTAR
jgi:hypothetical protein